MKISLHKNALKCLGASCLILSMSSQAALYNRGNGLIYDDLLDVTWMQDANLAQTLGFDSDGRMTWSVAKDWADGLVFGGFDDWRLPNIVPLNGTEFDAQFSFDGSTDRGYNQSPQNNELVHMFQVNLNNTSAFDEFGNLVINNQINTSFLDGDTGELFSFSDVDFSYWNSVANTPFVGAAWAFNFHNGNITIGETFTPNTSTSYAAWLVRDGDVAVVDEPDDPVSEVSSPALSGLFGLAFLGMLFGRNRLINCFGRPRKGQ